jgi:hypothetical protein
MELEALPVELLALCFLAAADEGAAAPHPRHLARVACVSRRCRRVADERCWRLKARRYFPELAAAVSLRVVVQRQRAALRGELHG